MLYILARVLIDTNELRTIGSRLLNLAGDSDVADAVAKTDKLYDKEYEYEYEFSRKEELVFRFIKDNPGTIQENIVKNVHEYSRITVLKAISNLEKHRFIAIEEDRQNSRIHHLFINKENELASLIKDVDRFKQEYFYLLKIAKKKLENLNKSFEDIDKRWDLIDALIMPYKSLIVMSVISDIFLREEVVNKLLLQKKFSIIYSTIQEIHIKLYETIPDKVRPYDKRKILPGALFRNTEGLTFGHIAAVLKTFERFELSESAEKVIDAIWKINYPILPIVDNYYSMEDPEVLKDWRKILSEIMSTANYKPKTKQDPHLYNK